MQLTEKHRPSRLAQVIGQAATVSALQTLLNRGMGSSAIYLTGPSGAGKTSTARTLVAELKIDARDITTLAGVDCLKETVADVIQNFGYSAWGDSQWKACIVDESHAMSERAVQSWLTYLEDMPARRLVIFTTTQAPETDLYGEFKMPLLSRCKVFTLNPDMEAFAVYAAKIASEENLNGRPLSEYRNLIASCGGNLRAALQKIECGRMLTPFEAPKVAEIAPQSTVRREMPSNAVKIASSEGILIDAELERGRKFCQGSRKYAAHLERLKELRGE